MRLLALTMLLATTAACPPKGAPDEPTPPPVPDAAPVDADPGPIQTPPENTVVLAASYPQHCTRDDDCIAVFEGDACNPCRCAWNAIRTEAFPKYKADLGAFWSCFREADCKTACSQAIGDAAKCEGGTCILPPP